jgi:lipopolysaccharide transport system permease protein
VVNLRSDVGEHLKTPSAPSLRQNPTIRVERTTGWKSLGLQELWEYRDLLRFLIRREIKGRYRQMALGPLWILIKPLADMVIFSLIFGGLADLPSEGLPYPIFTYSALLPWTLFAGSLTSAAGSLRYQMNMISKVYFPRLIMPISQIFISLADFSISFIVLLGMMLYFGYLPTLKILTIPLFLLMAVFTSLAVGLWLAGVSVRFRDVAYGVNYGTRLWMWATPVAYSVELVAEKAPRLLWLYKLNPMYWVIQGFRWALLDTGEAPTLLMLVPFTIVILLLVSGLYIFRRTEKTIVDLQ